MSERMSELVSVLMLTYNSAKTIEQSLSSLLLQTYPYWELLIYDDCSSDGTTECLNDYINSDHRIKEVGRGKRHIGHRGIGVLRNLCLSQAKGEFVAVLDSDDVRYPINLETCIGIFQQDETWSIIATQYDEIDIFSNRLPPSNCLHKRRKITQNSCKVVDITNIIERSHGGADCAIAPCTAVLRHDVVLAVGGFSQSWQYHTDSNLYRRIVKLEGTKIGLLGSVTAGYRFHENQRSMEKRASTWVEPTNL